MKNTSVALGSYFDDFIKAQIAQGRYNNASEVIRAGLRLLEDNENQALALKKAILDGLDSGIAEDFDPAAHLRTLKAAAHNGYDQPASVVVSQCSIFSSMAISQ